MTNYLHPRIYPGYTAPHREIMNAPVREICAEGPARTGKTLRNLRKLLALHFKYEGFMSCIVRTNSVDLDDTIRFDLRNILLKYDLEDPRSPIEAIGGNRFHTLKINGGEMRLGGMNRPGRILGTQYDAVMLSELSQFTDEQYQMLKTRCSGSAGNWRLPNGDVFSQMISDTNPDVPDHPMYQREQEGLLTFIKFGFRDNPNFFRQGRWSKIGKTTVEELNVGLTGIYHDRYFKGLRRAPEGMVFEIRDSDIVDDLPDDLDRWLWYNAMDFGMSAPSVCLWIAENKVNGQVLVFKEWRHTQKTSIEMGTEVNAIRRQGRERILHTIIDNDEEKQRLLRSHCRIVSTLTEKGPGSVFHRTLLLQNALKENRLKFYRHLRCTSDPELARRKKPLDVIAEMRLAHFPADSKADENPVKGDDHGIDALGYWFLWREAKGRDVSFGFGSGGATRRR